MTKAIFFDIDGTLVPLKTKVYGASVKQALEKLRSRGILPIIGQIAVKLQTVEQMLTCDLKF